MTHPRVGACTLDSVCSRLIGRPSLTQNLLLTQWPDWIDSACAEGKHKTGDHRGCQQKRDHDCERRNLLRTFPARKRWSTHPSAS